MPNRHARTTRVLPWDRGRPARLKLHVHSNLRLIGIPGRRAGRPWSQEEVEWFSLYGLRWFAELSPCCEIFGALSGIQSPVKISTTFFAVPTTGVTSSPT